MVQLDREKNRHAAFGLGRHRCLGSSLARMELRVALQEWMARYPDFELADPAAVTWSGGQVRGPRTLPVTILSALSPRPVGLSPGTAPEVGHLSDAPAQVLTVISIVGA